MGFLAGCMACTVLVACGGGGELVQVEPAVIVCRSSDEGCRTHAALVKTRVCRVMPAGLLVYLGDEVNDSWLDNELRKAGAISVGNWIEGEDCD